jgi:DNA-binding NtrC family response regulator
MADRTPEAIMKILVIDDDPHSLAGLKMMLEQQGGHQCTAHQNPLEALAEYARDHFDAVISDIRMPEMSGLELSRRLHEINPAAQVILISGHEIQSTEEEVVKRRCCCFFAKPLRAGTILEALKKLIKSHIDQVKDRSKE